MKDKAIISVIIPMLNESDSIPDLRAELSSLNERHPDNVFEFIVIDDGSQDDTWKRLLEWAEDDPKLSLIKLAANAGPHNAMRAGLGIAVGDACILYPADLQDSPEMIDTCLAKWHEDGKMVMTVPQRQHAYDHWSDSVFASVFYALLKFNTPIYKNLPVRSTLKLMNRAAVAAFTQNPSKYALPKLCALRARLPYHLVTHKPRPRRKGSSKWTFRRKVAHLWDHFLGANVGILAPWPTLVVAFTIFSVTRILGVFWTSAADALRVTGDLVFAAGTVIVMSIIGLYIIRIHAETAHGPIFLVDQVIRGTVNQEKAAVDRQVQRHLPAQPQNTQQLETETVGD